MNNLSRILITIFVLILSVITLSVPISAAASIDLDKSLVDIGETVTLTGSGFPVSSELYVFFARQQASVGDEIDVDVTVYSFVGSVVTFFDGRIIGFPFNIPTRLDDGPVLADEEDVFGGMYYVYVTYENSETIRAVTSTRVISNAVITGFYPNQGTVGTEVEISGGDFLPSEALIVEYEGQEIEIDSGDKEADNDGEFTLYIIIPDSEYGEHTVTIKGEDSLAELEETFNLEPLIIVNPDTSEIGAEITITGFGFNGRNGVEFSFDSTQITNILWLLEPLGRTNPDGTFIVQVAVPDLVPGSYILLAEDEDNGDIFATESFTIEPGATPTPTPTVTSTITLTNTQTATVTSTTTQPTTQTTTVTSVPAPTTITSTVIQVTTSTPSPTTVTAMSTVTEKVSVTTTITIQSDRGSQINIWLPIVSALGAIILTIVVLVIYSSRQRGL
ncbi:MAG: hypothetical protein JSV74_02280 [Dehalococcoidia bacterium]|nr:MAG: hypothetical protein JSV74_02280 [Dehalococcoidia bacterium]